MAVRRLQSQAQAHRCKLLHLPGGGRGGEAGGQARSTKGGLAGVEALRGTVGLHRGVSVPKIACVPRSMRAYDCVCTPQQLLGMRCDGLPCSRLQATTLAFPTQGSTLPFGLRSAGPC